ncbi:hypothetical protein [Microcoleus sp. herbarium5]|uniref:hypothetical protein n=1 Tax=Microcoleus sp. herbarium5 TaxID=3055434 RepID=UPI002FD63CBB
MTFNLRGGIRYGRSPLQDVALRAAAGAIAQYAPDVIGTQEGKEHLISCDRL